VKENSFIYSDFAHTPTKVKATVSALRMQYPDHLLIICLELHCYSSMNEFFIDHYSGTLDEADNAIVFYDPNAASYKKIPIIAYDRIKRGFLKRDLQIFSDRDRMLTYLETLMKNHFVLAFLTSGRFGGLDLPGIAADFQLKNHTLLLKNNQE
jgi:UDP-N-acetylmuramate: L-alanyl-gamma-D-glutamyl-meso-diaminopimelate ligase